MNGTRRTAVWLVASLASAGGCGGGRVRTERPAEIPTALAGAPDAAIRMPPPDLATQMEARSAEWAADMVPGSPLHLGALEGGEDARFEAVLEAGRCYRVIGVASEMIELALSIADENGNALAEDTGDDDVLVLGQGDAPLCPRWTGPFVIRALASSGRGEYGLQLFRTP